ncbi:MAG: hypothetical protein IJQ28_00165, partial [Clostridia bacterium]|nr:hypothetical protein [Clostridia bacterium]
MNINFYKKAEEMRKKAEKEKIEQEKKKKEKINQEKKKQEMAKKEKEVKDKTTAETRKKEIDKFNSLLYNKNNNTLNDAWKRTKEMELRYAGDSARESVEKGLKESSDFMKDAPEGTDYGKVQTASVKWRLANDTDNKELQKSAFDELTGHLSSENKETYLKNARSLQEYINAKDTFDYKRNNYTTTKSANSEYNEEIRKLQKILNINGYTDKFGDILKEDGIYGAKTRYAHDKMAENTKKTNPDMPAELANMMLPNLAQTWGNGTPKKTGFEKYNNINFDPIDILSKQGET